MPADPARARFVGLLLAAGYGRRFGTDKLMYPLADGTPVAVGAARVLRAACPDSIAVLRPDQTALAKRLAGEGLRVVTSAVSTLGMGHSLAAGVRASADAAGWIVALADMPFIAPATVRQVADALRDAARTGHAQAIVAPALGSVRGHPVGFMTGWRDALSTLQGDAGAGRILKAHPEYLRLLAVDDAGILRDIDIPGDLG
ncbi:MULTISPECIES: nucleotidyltransferase family protein [Candidatus Accumulibacter]|uniref:Purine catabolism protein PucB n=2 Tax=Candidatus Accumulibacter TaxID=327159 RepID=A0A080M762_9PROT|nr:MULTISPECIES: nucleotidyltransferase family protein [Candidatus Accumulibacter]KFB76340.1 MAG: Purine catabolism protein PucB [Candidatus Accumulibacter cognatus]MCC2869440.1 nucleotidyltransferase family protein [Candidatus Accumulibacter phosphatis]HMW54100.1 nucleotidyltransferase family protein [Accumulibacter sp.]